MAMPPHKHAPYGVHVLHVDSKAVVPLRNPSLDYSFADT
jgi:hypothetical protein